MAFHEVRLPIEIERGASGGPGFLTSVSTLNSGREQRNQLWEIDRGKWDIGYGIQTRADALAIRNFFFSRRGKLHGFRFRDWSNYKTEGATRQPAGIAGVTTGIAEADGVATQFQLWHVYDDGFGFTYAKEIFKPVEGNISVYRNGQLLFQDDSDSYGIDYTTGVITFDAPPEYNAVIEWTGVFDLPVRFDTDDLEIVVTTKEVLSQPSIPIVELKL